MLRKILSKIGEGILIGVGVGLTIWAVTYVQSRSATSTSENVSMDMAGFKSYGPGAKLSIKSHRPKPSDPNSAFIGEVANQGSDAWHYVHLVVELFGKDGTFVGKCSDSLDGPIGPGQVRHFEVSCSGCRNNSVPAYDHYTIEIVDATFEQSTK